MKPLALRSARTASLAGTLAVCAAALGLLWPRAASRAAPERVALLVDLSRSVRARWPDAAAVLDAAVAPLFARARAAHAELVTIGYGAEVLRAGDSMPSSLLARLDGSASELDAALEAARGALGAAGRRRIVILSDGGFTGRDPRARLAALEDEGVGLEWPALPPRTRDEWLLGDLRAGPARVGAPLALELEVGLARGPGSDATHTLRFEVESQGQRTNSSELVRAPSELAPDAQGWIRWPLRRELAALAAGTTRVRAAWATAAGDEAESVLELAVRARGSRPRALCLGPDAPPGAAEAPVEWAPMRAADFAAQGAQAELLLTTDTGWSALDAAELRAWIRRGGAWIACAAPENFPLDWRASGFAALLPLEPASQGLAARDVVFLLDGSGSMVGEPWKLARAALAPLVAAGSAEERLFVQEFAGALGPAEPLGAGVPAREASGGPTALLDALLALARTPSERERLVILLSDGQDRAGAAALARAGEVREALAGSRTALAPIAVGEQANRALLGALATRGQELLSCPALDAGFPAEALAALFRRQLGARQWSSGGALAASAAALDPALDSLRAALAAGNLRADRLAALAARPAASVLLLGPEGAPALALRREGLGWVAACACDPSALRGAAWPTLALFLAAQRPARSSEVELHGRKLRVAPAPDARAAFRAELRTREERAALVLEPRGEALECELPAALAGARWDELVLAPGSAEELVLPWPRRRAAEDELPRRGLDPAERRASEPASPPAGAGQPAWPLGLLAAGLALLALGALAGFFSGARAPSGKRFPSLKP